MSMQLWKRRRALVLAVAATALALPALVDRPIASAAPHPTVQPPTTVTFTATGQVMQQFVVPATVTSLTYDVRGASGAGGGGRGGRVFGTVTVTPGTVLDIWVGLPGTTIPAIAGSTGGAGGWGGRNGLRHGGNGGLGADGSTAGGGGGATEVVVHGSVEPLILGGGGGGAGARAAVVCGGAGTGGCGAQGPTNGAGTNGGLGVPGEANNSRPDECRGAGGDASGGLGGNLNPAWRGEPAATGAGGRGGDILMGGNGGGGGGGGGYGGGGGGAPDLNEGCGGGSGRSLAPNLTATFTSVPTTGGGSVSFTFIPPDPPVAPAGATRFVPLAPFRLLDTRDPSDVTGGNPVPAGGGIDLQVTGRGGVPATNVSAVVLNVTAANAASGGFVTIWPAGQNRPEVSNLNTTFTGQNIANLTTVRLGANGKVSLFSQSGTDLVADVAGYYEPVQTLTTSGRYTPLSPVRILDTRASIGVPGTLPVPAATSIDLVVAGRGGVPSTGATAVVLNLTAAEAVGAGFVTVWPAGTQRPTASNLNVTSVGQNIANLVIVPLGQNGAISLFTQGGTHLLADVAGWFGDATQPATFSGLFQPLTPVRLLDTRALPSVPASGVPAGTHIDLAIGGHGGVPATGASAVVLNVTAAQASASGFVTVWPSGITQPVVSNLNVTAAGQNIPNLASVALGAGSSVSMFTQSGTHLLADVAGYYIG